MAETTSTYFKSSTIVERNVRSLSRSYTYVHDVWLFGVFLEDSLPSVLHACATLKQARTHTLGLVVQQTTMSLTFG